MPTPKNLRFLPIRTTVGAWKIKLKLSYRLTGDDQFHRSESEPVDVDRDPDLDLLCQQTLIARSKFFKMDDGLDV